MAADRQELGAIVPFGKYKGQPVEVMAGDRDYVDWLMSQAWFRERHAAMHTIIVNNFQEPSETPEHNAMQARFLDNATCMQAGALFLREKGCEYYRHLKIDARSFEDGSDVTLHISLITFRDFVFNFTSKISLMIELKPILSDDYPAVLRQCKRQKSNLLLVDRYDGRGASWDDVKKIFKASEIAVENTSELKLFIHDDLDTMRTEIIDYIKTFQETISHSVLNSMYHDTEDLYRRFRNQVGLVGASLRLGATDANAARIHVDALKRGCEAVLASLSSGRRS